MQKNILLIAFLSYLPLTQAQTISPNASDADTTESENVRVYTLKELQQRAVDTSHLAVRRNFIAFSLGPSLATGKFSQTDNRNLGDGFAQNGFSFRFEYAGFWNKNAGFGFSTGTFTNRVDEKQLTAFFPPIKTADNPSEAEQVFSNVKPWRSYYLFAGPYVSVPLTNVFIDFKCLGGFVLSRFPGFDYIQRSSSQTGSTIFTVVPISNIAFGFNAGTAVRLKLSKGTQMMVGLDYIWSRPNTSYAANDRTGTRIDVGRQHVSVFNLSWGLAFNVGKRKID